MNQGMSSTPTPMPEQPKKSNTGLIIAIIVIVVLCLCCVLLGGAYYLYQNGDRLLNPSALVLSAL